MKKEIMPLYNNVILRPYSENPYVEMQSEDGLLLTDDQFDSQDSGETEKRDLLIGCGQVIEIGPECKYLQIGDDVFYNTVTVRPVPFQRQGFLLCSEQSILAVMNDDLTGRFIKE